MELWEIVLYKFENRLSWKVIRIDGWIEGIIFVISYADCIRISEVLNSLTYSWKYKIKKEEKIRRKVINKKNKII